MFPQVSVEVMSCETNVIGFIVVFTCALESGRAGQRSAVRLLLHSNDVLPLHREVIYLARMQGQCGASCWTLTYAYMMEEIEQLREQQFYCF